MSKQHRDESDDVCTAPAYEDPHKRIEHLERALKLLMEVPEIGEGEPISIYTARVISHIKRDVLR